MSSHPRYTISIHLGANSLSLLISQETEGHYEAVDYLEQPIPLARDIFSSERVKRDTIERCVDVLESFEAVYRELGLTREHVTVAAATNILREAKNYSLVLNRLMVASGLPFHLLDDGGMTRLIYRKVERHHGALSKEGKVLAVHVGPGNTRVLLLNEGRVERYMTYRLGSHRSAEALYQTHMDGPAYLQVIRAHCEPFINEILYDFQREELDSVLLIGSEVQRVERENDTITLSGGLKQFRKTLKRCAKMSESERLTALQLDYHSEDAFLPALQINLSLLEALEVDNYWIPPTEYERGLLMDLPVTQSRAAHFLEETLHAGRRLAQHYYADEKHYEHVLRLAESLFHQTQQIHHMSEWELFLLQMAAILHEVGGYISPRMHHKHAYYLISNSDIFGLDHNSLEIIAIVARYHRQSAPKRSHKEYRALSREDQVLVSKLAALLRVADALDASQQQRVQDLTITQRKDRLRIEVRSTHDLALEQIALRKKGDLFEQLFGLELTLQSSH